MKKILIIVLAIGVIVAAVLLAGQAIRKTGKAYMLAVELKKAGLPVEEIRISESSAMYSEVSVLGGGLNVKIGYYSNGLFMDKIIKNLESGKKREPGDEAPAILVSRLYILVVYSEPDEGMVKKMLAEKFGQVREY